MKAIEFQSRFNPNGTLAVPAELTSQIPANQDVRVLVLVGESEEEAAWNRLAAEQFLKGYHESDSIYDQLSSG